LVFFLYFFLWVKESVFGWPFSPWIFQWIRGPTSSIGRVRSILRFALGSAKFFLQRLVFASSGLDKSAAASDATYKTISDMHGISIISVPQWTPFLRVISTCMRNLLDGSLEDFLQGPASSNSALTRCPPPYDPPPPPLAFFYCWGPEFTPFFCAGFCLFGIILVLSEKNKF